MGCDAPASCVARPADPGRTGFCENTGYQQSHREFIFTVQFSYDLTQYDGGDQYDYMHLVYLAQYDNNISAVARHLGKGRTQVQRWMSRYRIRGSA